jgi:hypothetical protein
LRRYTKAAGKAAHDELSVLSHLGEAVQVDPIKPTLKAPKSTLLNLEHEKSLSNYAFKFNLRRYTWAAAPAPAPPLSLSDRRPAGSLT